MKMKIGICIPLLFAGTLMVSLPVVGNRIKELGPASGEVIPAEEKAAIMKLGLDNLLSTLKEDKSMSRTRAEVFMISILAKPNWVEAVEPLLKIYPSASPGAKFQIVERLAARCFTWKMPDKKIDRFQTFLIEELKSSKKGDSALRAELVRGLGRSVHRPTLHPKAKEALKKKGVNVDKPPFGKDRVVKALTEPLQDKAKFVRLGAASWLGVVGDVQAIKALEARKAVEKDKDVKRELESAIATIKKRAAPEKGTEPKKWP